MQIFKVLHQEAFEIWVSLKKFCIIFYFIICLQCFETVGWAPGRASGLRTAQLMPLPLTVSCFSKIQIGFSFLLPAHLGSLGQRAVKQVCVCVCVFSIFIALTLFVGHQEDHKPSEKLCVICL